MSAVLPVAHLSASVHSSFTPRSSFQPLSVNFDLYGDRRWSSPTFIRTRRHIREPSQTATRNRRNHLAVVRRRSMRQRRQLELGNNRATARDRGAPPRAPRRQTTAARLPPPPRRHPPTSRRRQQRRLLQAVRQPGRQRRDVPEGLLRRCHRHARRTSRPTSPSSTAAAARARAAATCKSRSSTSPAPTASVKDEDKPKYKGGEFVYVPTVIAPITMSYNLPERRQAAAVARPASRRSSSARSRSGTTR